MESLEAALVGTFNDYRLSKDDQLNLSEFLQAYKNNAEALDFVRNKAFLLVNEYLQKQPTFDLHVYNWLEKIIKIIDRVRDDWLPPMTSEAYFPSDKSSKERVLSLINGAQQSLEICAFTLYDDALSAAILQAHERLLDVRIIIDDNPLPDSSGHYDLLRSKGVHVVKDTSAFHMRHRFALLDDKHLITGSFNSAQGSGGACLENICVLSEPQLVTKFSSRFKKLWKEFK